MNNIIKSMKYLEAKKEEYNNREVKYLEYPIFCQSKVNNKPRLEDLQARYVQAGKRFVDRSVKDERDVLRNIFNIHDIPIADVDVYNNDKDGKYVIMSGVITDVRYTKNYKDSDGVASHILVCSPKVLLPDGEFLDVSDHIWLDLSKMEFAADSTIQDIYLGEFIQFAAKIDNYGEDNKRFGVSYWALAESNFLYSTLKECNIRVPRKVVDWSLKDQTPILKLSESGKCVSPASKKELIESMQSILNRDVNVNMFNALQPRTY